jgi:hypothetical protein
MNNGSKAGEPPTEMYPVVNNWGSTNNPISKAHTTLT